MRGAWALILLAGCDKLFDLQELPAVDGERARTITITQAGASELVDFPVSIELTDGDLAQFARADGHDIHFTDVDGGELPFELVAYAQGSLEAWVRITLPHSVDIEMRYGGDAIAQDSTLTWSSRYAAVWHFPEPTGGAFDSTGHGYDLAPVSDEPGSAPGVVGNARTYVDSGTVTQRLCAPPSRAFDQAMRSFSYSMWLQRGVLDGTYDQPFCAGGLTTGQPGFSLEITTTATNVDLSDPTLHVELPFAAAPSGWVHHAAVIDRDTSAVRTYTDSVEVVTPLALTGNITTSLPICMGGPNGYSGLLDEVRVYTEALSPEWIRAERDNITNRSRFVVVADP